MGFGTHPYFSHATVGPVLRRRPGALRGLGASPDSDGGPDGGPDDAVTGAYAVGGSALAEKVQSIAVTYGVDVATKFAALVGNAPSMVDAYKVRAAAVAAARPPDPGARQPGDPPYPPASPGADAAARAAVHVVSAAENQALTSVLRGAPAVPERVGSRDVKGAGGYVYRQYADNSVTILAAPGNKGRGVTLRSGPAFDAVLREIGAFPPAQAAALTSTIAQLQTGLTGLAQAAQAGGANPQVVSDILKVGTGALTAALAAGGTAVAGGAATGTSAVVGGLLTAAGVSASVPVAGWIAAGGAALAAATIGTVAAVKGGQHRNEAIAAAAKKAGIPDAEAVPAFTARILKLSSAQRHGIGARLERALRHPRLNAKMREKLSAKLRIIAAVELMHMAEQRRGKKGTARPAALGCATCGGRPEARPRGRPRPFG